ncbi:MAG: GNAT family N-acetyltransferase [Hyphomicrobiaceae bacterium]
MRAESASEHDGPAALAEQAGAVPTTRPLHLRVARGYPAFAEALAHVASEGCRGTVFQSSEWLRPAAALELNRGAREVLLTVLSDDHGTLLALPLAVHGEGGVRVARFIDGGISDYGAPLMGPAVPRVAAASSEVWRALARGLSGIDVLRLEKLPGVIAGAANPLAHHSKARASRFNANRLDVPDTVEAFVASRGKKYRKEWERCQRRIAEMGIVTFERAATSDAIEKAYRQLEAWQSTRHREAGHAYALDDTATSRFYLDLLLAHADSGFAGIFTLSVAGQPVAILYGVARDGTFTLLRIADAGEDWKTVSPGRLVVLETMRHFLERGVRTFDMGIGDYPFKHWIGCEQHPLFDLVLARTLKGMPHVAVHQARAWARSTPAVANALRRLRSGVAGMRGGASGGSPAV